jgi:hypothetical protein
MPENFNVNKADQADLLNKSMQFFKENESFSFDDFTEQVIQQPEVIQSFRDYKEEFESDRDIKIDGQFDISTPAVKKQAKVYKSVIKLDKNFHIYVHGNRRFIEKGYDEERDMQYYKIYYKEEN